MKYGNETGHFVSDLKGEGFMNGIVGTFIVLAVLVVIVCLIVRSMIKDKKSGKSLQCAGDCFRNLRVNDDCSQEERLKNFPYCVNIKTIWEVF